MSTSPSQPPAPHRARRHVPRPHLHLVRPGPQAVAPARAGHLRAPHRHEGHVTVIDAVAVLAALYVAVVLIRFIGW